LTVLVGMAGCGGGGGGDGGTPPAIDYSKINGKYTCYDAFNSIKGYAQMEFTSTNLKYSLFLNATDIPPYMFTYDANDYIGTQNGFPLVTEKVANSSTKSDGFIFSLPNSSGVPTLYMTTGLTADVQQGIITSPLATSTCKKQ